jgi:hypothetical protein
MTNFTKQNSTWTIEEVTYRRTNAPNLSSKDGLSKKIENREQEQQEHGFEQWSGVFWVREWSGRWKNKWRARGPTPCHGVA